MEKVRIFIDMKESQLKQLVKTILKEMNNLDNPEMCSACSGTGEGKGGGVCSKCKGRGTEPSGDEGDPDYPPPTARGRHIGRDDLTEQQVCSACNGSGEGKYDGTKCLSCKGSGVEGYRGKLSKRNDPDYDWDAEIEDRKLNKDPERDWGGVDEIHPDDSPSSKEIDTKSLLYKLGNQLMMLDSELSKHKKWTPERIKLEDERVKLWLKFRKLLGAKPLKEDLGLEKGKSTIGIESLRREVESLVNKGGKRIGDVWYASPKDYPKSVESFGAIVIDGSDASDIIKMGIFIGPSTTFHVIAKIRGESNKIDFPNLSWNQVKQIIKQYTTGLREDHGLGYSHNTTASTGVGERDSLTDPMLTGKPLKETSTFQDKWKPSKDIPHPYNATTEDIAKQIASKAARARDEYHMSYEQALKSMLAYIQNEIKLIPEPPKKFPA